MGQGLTIKVHIDGARDILRAFSALPRAASEALRDASGTIAAKLARSAQAAGRGTDAQSAAVASTVKVGRDRLPVVQAGGSAAVTSDGRPAYALLFGSEFGANGRYGWYGQQKYASSDGRQFHSHSGRDGRWFFPTIEREAATIEQGWLDAAETIVRELSD